MKRVDKKTSLAPLCSRDYRRLFVAVSLGTMAGRALQVVLGYEVYAMTKSTLALGGMGLAASIPAVVGALFGGHVADRYDRRRIMQMTFAILCASASVLALVKALVADGGGLWILYAAVFTAAGAKGFLDPAANGLEAQVVPREQLAYSAVLTAICWLVGATVGPVLGGAAFAATGSVGSYALIGLLCAAACLCVTCIAPKPARYEQREMSAWKSIGEGVTYVSRRQELWTSMVLDLFAVLLGGAVAMLPAFAHDVLQVGPLQLGILYAAPPVGALAAMLLSTQYPPIRHASNNLLLAVAGFGIAMIVFAVSKSFALSAAALFFSGVFDGFSEVIRRSMLRLLSPDRLRGRIASVNMLFVGASNELGALESGLAATAFGLARSVWLGGAATLMIAAVVAVGAPRLRGLQLDPAGILRDGRRNVAVQ